MRCNLRTHHTGTQRARTCADHGTLCGALGAAREAAQNGAAERADAGTLGRVALGLAQVGATGPGHGAHQGGDGQAACDSGGDRVHGF